LFNFCSSCDPFLGSVMSFILPINIGIGDGGHVPPKISLKNIFAGNLLRKIRTFFGQKSCRIQEYCYFTRQIG